VVDAWPAPLRRDASATPATKRDGDAATHCEESVQEAIVSQRLQ
jgi:hypothetical protein